MSIHNNPAVILDNGSGYLKCGMSNNQFPDFSLPALVGRPMLRYEENVEGIQIKVSILLNNTSLIKSLLQY